MDFQKFWSLVAQRGRVAHLYFHECEDLWNTFSPEQQKAIYEEIQRKLRAGLFVSFRPTDAIRDNVPRKQEPIVLSYDEYYTRFNTTDALPGWKKVRLEDQQKTIYVKQ